VWSKRTQQLGVTAALLVVLALYVLLFLKAAEYEVTSREPTAPSRSLTATTQPLSVAVPACMEDDPCWVWPKMGNRKRGVYDLARKQYRVVTPCQFRMLWMNGDADLHKDSQRMRGDWYAIHHGCDNATVTMHANGTPEVRG
jgi:hypothetical protein